MQDITTLISPQFSFAAILATTTQTGAWIDLQGFDAASVLFETGIGGITFDGTNNIAHRIQHSDDGVTAAADPLTADLLFGVNAVAPVANGQIRLINAAHAAPSFTQVGYKGGRRFIRAVQFFAGTHGTGTLVSARVLRGQPWIAPTA